MDDNLNNWLIPTDTSQMLWSMQQLKNRSIDSKDLSVSVYFRNIEDELIQKINQYPVVIGCVAWLTNKKILEALSLKQFVSIVIQKEDFLRPDTGVWSGKKLRSLYEKLPPGVSYNCSNLSWSGNILDCLNYNYAWQSEPIRWVGNFNTDKKPAFPRMHNKFLVFCDIEVNTCTYQDLDENGNPFQFQEDDGFIVIPKAVWTGSFNLTDNATKSLENAVYLTDCDIVHAYYDEWEYIFALSESIASEAWDKKWNPPTFFRLGT